MTPTEEKETCTCDQLDDDLAEQGYTCHNCYERDEE